MTSQSISLAMFVISAPISLVGYAVSDEPFNLALVVLIVLTCYFLSYMPYTTFEPYERREMQPPINEGSDWDVVIEVHNELQRYNYEEIIPPLCIVRS